MDHSSQNRNLRRRLFRVEMLETRRLLASDPVSNSDFYTVNEDTLLNILSPGVLANDSDADGDSISASLVAAPSNGSLTLDSNGSFRYLPQSNFFGTDIFTYRAFDGTSYSSVATVVVTVNPVNDAPVAVNDTFSVNEDSTLTLPSVAVGQLTMTSDFGDYVGQGLSYNFSTPAASFAVVKNFSNGVSIDVGSFGQFWSLDFSAPGNALITPGIYRGAVRWPFQSASQPGLSVSGNGRGSNTLTGEFTVNDVEYGPGNSVLRFVATFEQHNEGVVPALRGSINYSAAVPTNGSLLANDSDGELNPLRSVLVAGPANGAVTLNTNGTFAYTPKVDFFGVDTFTYRAFDGTDYSNIATVTVTVNPINDAPYVDPASITTNEDLAYNGTIVVRDPESDAYTVTLATGPSHGITNVNSNGLYTYTPSTNYYGQDSFVVRATDSNGASRLGTVTVKILPVNDAPVAQNDNFSVDEDSTLSLPSIVVSRLTMKSDPGDYIGQGATYDLNAPLAVFSFTNFSDNTVYLHVGQPNQDWTLIFAGPQGARMTPGPYLNAIRWPFQDPTSPGLSVYGNYRGTNSLTGEFIVNEIEYDSNNVLSRFNASFVQRGDSTTPNAALTGSIAYNTAIPTNGSVLANDTDAEQNVLKSILLSGPTNGSLSLNANGTLVYTPNPNFSGTDSFTYKANDGQLDSNVATVTLTVNPINDAPDAVDDLATTLEDVAIAIPVLSNDTDIDSQLTIVSATGPTTINANGTITYTPPADFNGLATFSYTVSDGMGGVDTAVVTVTVAAVNDNPDAVNDVATTNEDTAVTIAVLANDTDIEGNALTIVSATGPTTINANGTITYRPSVNFNGLVTFTYTVSDGNGGLDTAIVTLTVLAVNDAPVALNDNASTVMNVPVTINVLSNDSDVDGDTLTVVSATGPTRINGNGTITFTPTANFVGNTSFVYTMSDGKGGAATATVNVEVRPNTGVTLVNGTLLIQGTNQADSVSIKALNKSTVRVSANFLAAGFTEFRTNSIQMILVHLYDGNDIIDYSGQLTIPAILDGGNGNDQIKGGAGRDLIIGGQGADVLFGFQNDDLIISGSTIYDNNDRALTALLNEWNSSRSFNSRVSNIRNGTGTFLSSQSIRLRKGLTLFDDSDVDQVFGGTGSDWIFFDPTKDSRESGDLEN